MAKVGKIRIRGGFSMRRAPMTFQMTKGWERFNNATNVQRFKRKFQRHRKKALDAVAKEILKASIDAGGFAENKPLTVFIKGSNKPLESSGKVLTGAITTRTLGKNEIFVGIPKEDKFYKQAVAVHEGAVIPVSPKMRQMFFMLWMVSIGERDADELSGRAKELWEQRPEEGWLPLSPGTQAIKIQPRPFMMKAFFSSTAKRVALEKFTKAVDDTIRELARGR